MARRPRREATQEQLDHGVPLVLDQLVRTLVAEQEGGAEAGRAFSGPSGGDPAALPELGVGATAHGGKLLALGYTVDQVVHDYGDLCQAITELAVERDTTFSVDSFRTLNRCLDNAIADTVSEFAAHRDILIASEWAELESERLGSFGRELREHVQVAVAAFKAIESGRLSIAGSTGSMLKHSLQRLDALVARLSRD